MASNFRFHVIDPDVRRRASVCHELMKQDIHAEIYEDVDEFCRVSPGYGVVLAADDPHKPQASVVRFAMAESGNVLPLVLYSSQPAPHEVVRAMLDGAFDFLEWPFDHGLLYRMVRRIAVDAEKLLHEERRRTAALSRIELLSRREKEVLALLVRGASNKEMAERLRISPRTVEIHRGNMMTKLNARSASDAIRIGLYAKLDDEVPLPQAIVDALHGVSA